MTSIQTETYLQITCNEEQSKLMHVAQCINANNTRLRTTDASVNQSIPQHSFFGQNFLVLVHIQRIRVGSF